MQSRNVCKFRDDDVPTAPLDTGAPAFFKTHFFHLLIANNIK